MRPSGPHHSELWFRFESSLANAAVKCVTAPFCVFQSRKLSRKKTQILPAQERPPSPPEHAKISPCPRNKRSPKRAAAPFRSSAISAVSARLPGTAKRMVLGRRGAFFREDHRIRAMFADRRLELRPQISRSRDSSSPSARAPPAPASPEGRDARDILPYRRASCASCPPPRTSR